MALLRISAPVGFGNLHLGPALFGFLAHNPGVDLTLDVDDRFVDVVREVRRGNLARPG